MARRNEEEEQEEEDDVASTLGSSLLAVKTEEEEREEEELCVTEVEDEEEGELERMAKLSSKIIRDMAGDSGVGKWVCGEREEAELDEEGESEAL